MAQLTIALAQIDIAFGQPEKNFQTVATAVAEAAQQGAEVVVLPEMWNTGYDLEHLATTADPDGLRTKAFLSALAQQYHLAIVGGSVAAAESGRFYNRSLMVDHHGRQLAKYDKVHRFRLMNEEKFITAGATADHLPSVFRPVWQFVMTCAFPSGSGAWPAMGPSCSFSRQNGQHQDCRNLMPC